MKLFKCLIFLITFTLICNICISVNADITSDHINNINLVEEENMTTGVDYKYYKMDTNFLEGASKTTRNVYTYEIKQSEYAHLATWTYSDKDMYRNRTLMDIAYDYEKQHPGWIVLGGVNAEGYYNGELTNAFVQDGDVIRKDVSAEAFKKLIGFKEDYSVVIKQVPTSTDTPLLKFDEEKHKVPLVNTLPTNSEDIAVFTNDLKGEVNVSGYQVVEATYSLFRTSTEFPNPNKTHSGSFYGIFLKGVVDNLSTKTVLNEEAFEKRKFYIVTKNKELANKLTNGKEIKIEFEYTDEFSDVVSMTGYMYRYLQDGVTIPVNHKETNDVGQIVDYNCDYYKSTSKERAGIGFKEDGTIVLLTSNTDRMGPTQFEVGEMFRILGCKDAYQFDGGGSVTFVKRNEFGQINMLNTPGDGSARSIMSGIFIVAPDPLLKTYPSEADTYKLTFHLKDLDFLNQVTDLTITHNNQKYNLMDDKIIVDGLEENTEYTFEVTYKLNGEEVKAKITGKTKEYIPPTNIISIGKITDTSIEIIKSEIEHIFNLVIYLENEPINQGTGQTIIIDNLIKDAEYEIYATYDIYDPNLNKTFNITTEKINVKTISFSTPTIEIYEESIKTKTLIGIKYKYIDPDNKVVNAYIEYQDETGEIKQYPLTSKTGTASITNLDFEKHSYSFKLVLEYSDENDKLIKQESVVLKYIIDKVETPEQPTQTPQDVENKKCGKKNAELIILTISLISMLALIIKKQK